MNATLRIERLCDTAWKLFGYDYAQSIADRDKFRVKLRLRFGKKIASDIQRHVDVALRRIQGDAMPKPKIMAMRAFYDLLALEMTILEIADRIDANGVFIDSNGLLRTLGMSWRQDVLRLVLDQTSPGYMPAEDVGKFLQMVRNADQHLPSDREMEGSADDIATYFRDRKNDLIEFLERASTLGESIWCDL